MALADAFVESGGVGGRFDAEFVGEELLESLLLAEGGGALIGPGVELHQGAVGLFQEGIEGQPAAGVGDGVVVATLSGMRCDQFVQGIA